MFSIEPKVEPSRIAFPREPLSLENPIKLPGYASNKARRLQNLLINLAQEQDEERLSKALKLVESLIRNQEDDPDAWYVASLVMFYNGNLEMAAFFGGLSRLRRSGRHYVTETFQHYMRLLEPLEGEKEYLEWIQKGLTHMRQTYMERQEELFAAGDFEGFDHYLQRATALEFPTLPVHDDVRTTAAKTNALLERQSYAEYIEDWEQQRRSFPPNADIDIIHKQIIEQIQPLLNDTDESAPSTVVQWGAASDGLLSELAQQDLNLISLNPHSNESYPNQAANDEKKGPIIHQSGSTDEMVAFLRDHYPRVDVFILAEQASRMTPDALQHLLASISGHVEHLLLLDDVANLAGERSLVRGHLLLHPYQKVLADNQYKIQQTLISNATGLGVNGILIAEREHSLN